MASDIFGVIRTIALIAMIVFAVLCEAVLIFCQQFWWASFWGICVIGGVIVWEIASYVSGKKTISTRWKEWEQKSVWAYIALIFMLISFLALIVHLAVWGGMFNP